MEDLDDYILKETEKEVREKIKEIDLNKYKSMETISLELGIENGKFKEDLIRYVSQCLITLGEDIVTKSGYHYLVTREGKNSNTLKLYIARNEYCIDCIKYLLTSSDIPYLVGIMLYSLLLGKSPDRIEKYINDILNDDCDDEEGDNNE